VQFSLVQQQAQSLLPWHQGRAQGRCASNAGQRGVLGHTATRGQASFLIKEQSEAQFKKRDSQYFAWSLERHRFAPVAKVLAFGMAHLDDLESFMRGHAIQLRNKASRNYGGATMTAYNV
jgi:hypothetical protein